MEPHTAQPRESLSAFEEECNDERRKSVIASLQEHLKGKNFSSTAWAFLWLADIEQLEYIVNSNVGHMGLILMLNSLITKGDSFITKCMYSQDYITLLFLHNDMT